ncbi:homoserine kinase [Alteriqipengyuania flavescens]|uniref:homoserine kinase n=1 Tax=Alteriqipengyuania flavescens TaxID=3053610 RepID=UPI0025B49B25|nr:homoserine kinase [Alteriqipengyuania flavescens]WJY19113.1 homoserine kinase [Alteriqipengyuania flavescens]WJY25054.1 homoserine kinase [Alteriqipengyuania flavescens]
MAVYTQLSAGEIAAFLASYDVGELQSVKGIAEGVSNSNWLVETTEARFILTRYEHRTDPADLPYFLGLMDHLSARGCPVPRTIHDAAGESISELAGRPAALIEFLPGLSIDDPNEAQARSVGAALAGIHSGAQGFAGERANSLGPEQVAAMFDAMGEDALGQIDPALPAFVAGERAFVATQSFAELPRGTIHADLFPDNVLMRGTEVGGLIDFYFACTDHLALDLATTHAAWAFDPDGEFRPAIAAALVQGYEGARPIPGPERLALPALARQACLRFVATRAQDWLAHDGSVLAPRKDPMDFVRRGQAYARLGTAAFGVS